MKAFDTIVAIYNPNSTKNAEEKAMELQREAADLGFEIKLIATTHAGHATEIARETIAKYKHPLLISVSGDGGYNELINGVMRARRRGCSPVVAVSAAGNANDHRRAVRDTKLAQLIRDNKVKPLDLIHVKGGGVDRFAHSYVGIGISAAVGVELNRHHLTPFKEAWLFIKTFWKFNPITIQVGKHEKKYGSLIFANIDRMAKYLKFDTARNKLDDNQFEIIDFEYRGRAHLLYELLRSAITGNAHATQSNQYTFRTTAAQAIQLDGEIEKLKSKSRIEVMAAPGAVQSIY